MKKAAGLVARVTVAVMKKAAGLVARVTVAAMKKAAGLVARVTVAAMKKAAGLVARVTVAVMKKAVAPRWLGHCNSTHSFGPCMCVHLAISEVQSSSLAKVECRHYY